MNTETEVIFQQDGSVLLQADGGWCHQYNTPAAAAWDAVRSICGSDPDYGWPNNMPSVRCNTGADVFRQKYVLKMQNQKQAFWMPRSSSDSTTKSQHLFFSFYSMLWKIPVSAMEACERGDTDRLRRTARDLSPQQLQNLSQAVLSIDFPVKTQEAIVMMAARRPYVEMEAER